VERTERESRREKRRAHLRTRRGEERAVWSTLESCVLSNRKISSKLRLIFSATESEEGREIEGNDLERPRYSLSRLHFRELLDFPLSQGKEKGRVRGEERWRETLGFEEESGNGDVDLLAQFVNRLFVSQV
jgi:hypothetical protein